ncbi:MAG: glycosyltransferase [Promethearchaeota archaeon]
MISIKPPVSIVIPTKNRGNLLPGLIKNLLNLDYPEYEIIIVDDCSVDNTKDLLKKYPVKSILLNKSVGSAEARNIGIRGANNEIIALTDSDCLVSRNWLNNLVPYLNRYDVVGGKVKFLDNTEAKFNPFNMNKEIVLSEKTSLNFLNTSNMLFKKPLWKSVGGFQNYRIEDMEFSWRTMKKGFKLIYIPRGLVYHYGNRTPFQNVKKYLIYGKSYSKIAFLHDMFFASKAEPIFNRKSKLYYLHLIGYSSIFFIVFFIYRFMIFNEILYSALICLLFILNLYLFFRIMKKSDILYKLYKFSVRASIIVYTLIYLLKKKKIKSKYVSRKGKGKAYS